MTHKAGWGPSDDYSKDEKKVEPVDSHVLLYNE